MDAPAPGRRSLHSSPGYFPWQRRLTTCGPPVALWVMVNEPLYVSLPVGLAVTLTVQVLAGANVVPQVLPATKDVPLTCMLEMVADALPVLLTVTV